MSYEKELLGFYVTGHPLDAYAEVLAGKNYQTIASLNELSDRAQFKVAGAIVQIEKKFTRKEGKPFAVIWVEDLTSTLEVVLWNEVFVEVSSALELGHVVVVKGTLDKRDDAVRATAQKVVMVSREKTNGVPRVAEPAGEYGAPAVLLQFSPAATSDELREVRQILTSSPGQQRVRLLFDRPSGDSLRVDAGTDYRINLTRDLEEKLARWLVTSKSGRRDDVLVRENDPTF
jgi:DNA polymerase-3 subunit alpha